MSLLSGTGRTIPISIQFYDALIGSFTLAASSTGSPYEVTGSRKSIAVNAAKNAAIIQSTKVLAAVVYGINFVIATNTTDNTIIKLQYSLNNAVSWTDFPSVTQSITGNDQNDVLSNIALATISTDFINASAPITNNVILFRLVVTDATSPTTDALTLTGIRCTVEFMVMI